MHGLRLAPAGYLPGLLRHGLASFCGESASCSHSRAMQHASAQVCGAPGEAAASTISPGLSIVHLGGTDRSAMQHAAHSRSASMRPLTPMQRSNPICAWRGFAAQCAQAPDASCWVNCHQARHFSNSSSSNSAWSWPWQQQGKQGRDKIHIRGARFFGYHGVLAAVSQS